MPIDPSTAFVSYAREDLEFVIRLAKDLKAKGAKVWMDKLDIRPGKRWEVEVEAALNDCSRMLVIVSPTSIASKNVLAEAAYAIDEGKEVIPVLYQDCKMPFRLRPYQYADFRTDYNGGLDELLATLTIRLDGTEGVATEPARSEAERKEADEEQSRVEKEGKEDISETSHNDRQERPHVAAEEEMIRQQDLERQSFMARPGLHSEALTKEGQQHIDPNGQLKSGWYPISKKKLFVGFALFCSATAIGGVTAHFQYMAEAGADIAGALFFAAVVSVAWAVVPWLRGRLRLTKRRK